MTRVDVYEALVAAKEHTETNSVQLNPEEKRLMERMILDRTRNGLALEQGKRDELLALRKKIMNLEVEFAKNCNEVGAPSLLARSRC